MLKYAATTIRNAVAVDAAISRNVKNPMPMGFLAPRENPNDAGDLEDPPNTQKIVDDWFDAVSRNAIPYLNGELQFNAVQWDPEKLGLNAAKDAVVLDIARFGGVDPEELAVSTTSRTYQNSQERRLDLLDFTAKAYITAIQGRLSMNDVTFPRRKVRAFVDGFLRSDTKTRMETYEVGRRVGVYNDERIARIEEIPSAKVPAPAVPTATPSIQEVQNMRTPLRSVGFSAPVIDGARFDVVADSCPQAGALFKVEREKRKITGLAIPWNTVAYSRGMRWAFQPGSLHWSEDSRVKLDMDHLSGTEFGKGEGFTATDVGLLAKFGVAAGIRGDEALSLAAEGVYDGLSIWATFDGPNDGYTYNPDQDVAVVYSATLRKVALTAVPAFDDARVTSVAASGNQRGNTNMPCSACGNTHAPGVACTPAQGGGVATATAPPAAQPPPQVVMHNGQAYTLQAQNTATNFDPVAFAEQLTQGVTTGLTAALTPLIEALPQPGGRPTVPAGRASVTREAPVYAMNGTGFSFVRDAWKARTESDHEARARVLKFQEQTADLARTAMETDPVFAINTGNASAVIPPGYRPDLFVSQLLKGRPMVQGISRGTINDATPFNIPAYRSSSGETATHVEGTNPSQGSMVLGTVTVSPGAVSGLFKITREMADSANPAIDAIATKAMAESYSQNTEGQVYSKLNGANGVGGTITSGFVPSGAQAYAINGPAGAGGSFAGPGDELLAQVRQSTAMYPFRRFAPIDFGFISAEATQAFAGAMDSTGRPLLPYEAPQNVVGTSDPRMGGYRVDGQVYVPAWSMTGNAAGDADVIAGAESDVWCWESPMLMFRFEERDGPGNIDLALFGYFAVEILRPIGLVGIRLTVT
jgi:HK97 family phage major capsid protein